MPFTRGGSIATGRDRELGEKEQRGYEEGVRDSVAWLERRADEEGLDILRSAAKELRSALETGDDLAGQENKDKVVTARGKAQTRRVVGTRPEAELREK